MKTFQRIIAALAVAAVAVLPAQAGDMFKFGIKAGANINKLSMTKDDFSSKNRCGFTGGVTAQFTIPVINIGADLSVMYVYRSSKVLSPSSEPNVATADETVNIHSSYIDIPLHLRYNLDLPAINKIIVPYIFTGPDFAFNCSRNIVRDYKNRDFDCFWDFGIGVRLVKHLEIGASYGIGMTKTLSYVGTADVNGTRGNGSTGRANAWTVTAAWFF